MAKDKFIGKVLSLNFEYVNTDETFRGYLIDYNEDWTLLKYNPFDYVIDGYIVLRNKYVDHFIRGKSEKFHQKILDLKGHALRPIDKIPIEDIETILNYLTEKYGVFQFDLRSSNYSYLGRVNSIVKSNLKIDFLDPKGKWSKKMNFKLGNIRTIQFDTDYINSLMLISKSNLKG